jgi:hypothetical protein
MRYLKEPRQELAVLLNWYEASLDIAPMSIR